MELPRRCCGRYDGQGLPPHRGRLPDRGARPTPMWMPCRSFPAWRATWRPHLSAQPGKDVSAFAPDNHDLGVKIRVENHEAAPRYAGVTVKNCKIAPSPEWMQNCLRAAGINPKNNLVDITNFVLFELGQPLHAFDAAKIEGREVVVHLRRRYALRDFGRRGAQAHGGRPDDLLGRASDVHRRRLRRPGFGHQRHHDRRVHRERLFQPRVGAQNRQALRPEHRFVVPFRARCRSQHAGLCRQACRPADEGAGRGRFRATSPTSTPRRSKISASTSRLPASTR